MTLYKAPDGSIHDDMDGQALSLPNWPQGLTEATAEQIAALTPIPPNPRIAEIKAELAAIDLKSIRPAREGDTARLATIEAQAVALRAELATL